MNDVTIGSPEYLKETHRSHGIVPLVNSNQDDLLNIAEVKLHQNNLKDLQKILLLVENAQDVNHLTAPKLLAQLSYGFRKAGEYAAASLYEYKEARADRKKAEAVAFVDGFREYVKAQKVAGVEIKATDEGRKHYINLDPEVRDASRKEALFEAMSEQLKTIKTEFMMAISTVKSIAYGYKDANFMSSTSTSVGDNE